MKNDIVKRDLLQPGGLIEGLIALRQAANLTSKQLAERLGWHASYLSRLETGQRLPTPEKVQAYLLACGASKPEQERALMKLDHLRRAYPTLEQQRRTAERQAAHERAAELPPTGPLREAYRQGYAAAVQDMQVYLAALTKKDTNHHV